MAIYPYKTESLTDFSKKENQEKYLKGLELVEGYLGKTYPLIIGGKRVESNKFVDSYNPANHKELIGRIHQAGIKEAEKAMQTALETFETWRKVSPKVRADVLFKAAAILKRRRFEFNALMTKEAGKPWIEADADTAEAIDFLEYYGRQMLELESIDNKIQSRRDIERNEYR